LGEKEDILSIFKVMVLGIILGILLMPLSGFTQSTVAEKEAIAATQTWLKLIDNGKYAQSWAEAAEYFKQAITQAQWEATLEAVKTPLGKVISRQVSTSEYSKSLPGAPDGEYVVILFTTSFENKKASIETVTLMKQADGSWKVSGYYIR